MARILIADDNPQDRWLYRTILEADGHEVAEAADGLQALDVAREFSPELVVSDVLMPRMDGFRFCREMHHDPALRHTPVVFCSANYLEPEHAALAAELGAREYLLKPVYAAVLRDTVRRTLSEGPSNDSTARLRALDETEFNARHTAALSDKALEKIQQLEDANRRLALQEQAFRALFENNPLPMWVFDLGNLGFLAVNDAAVARYGWSRDEFLGMTIADIRPPEDRGRLEAAVRQTPDGFEDAGQWRHRLRDGTVIDVQISGHRIDFSGRDAELIVARDITEQLRAERAAQAHLEQIEATLDGTVAMIMKLGELRDPYTAGHEQRVGQLAAAIARRLGLDEHRARGLEIMGFLHDIGKISVPAETLVKPRQLTPLEYEIVRQHAEQGYEILRHVHFPWPVAEAVRQHHERWDGSGYPRGLAGEALLLESRILGVADTVEAMSFHRPYRAALGFERALEEIERGAGSLYDPAVAAACLALFREDGFKFAP